MSWKSQSAFGVLATLAALLVYINATHSEHRVSYRPQYNQPSRTKLKQQLLEEMLRELISKQNQEVKVSEYDNGDDRYQESQTFADINALKNTLSTIDEISSQSTGCTVSPRRLITGNRFRVEDYQFTASSSWSKNYNIPRDARIGGISWCSASRMGANSWIQVDFGVNVIINEVLVGGSSGYILKTFWIEQGPNDTQLSPVLQPGSTRPMLFATGNTHIVKSFTLPAPITTRVLRIRTVTHTLDAPCVNLEAKGCPQFQGCEKDQMLSTDRSLLPLSSITSSSHTYTTAGEVTTTDWCSSGSFHFVQSAGPYIVFNFTRSVVLTYMIARGRSSQYVKQFSLDYKRHYSDDYTTYTLLNNKEAIFTAKGSNSQTYTFWKQPLEGVTFRFRIRDGQRSDGVFCWNIQLYGCTQDIECNSLPSIKNGVITYSPDNTPNHALNTVATYACNIGFVLNPSVGSKTRTCIDDGDGDTVGIFNGQAPSCIRKNIKCYPLPSIANGVITYSPDNKPNYALNTVATYACNAGFVMNPSVGSETRTCIDDGDGDTVGRFDGHAPSCIRKNTEILPTDTTGCIPYIRVHTKTGTDPDATQLKKDGSNIKLIIITEDGSYSAEHKNDKKGNTDEYLKILRSLLNEG